ncbi:MAG TPA: hypothetical protein VIO61_16135 [Anaerolineaceae bacterium]
MITGLFFALMSFLAGLVVFLIGLIGWIILKLMKEELHLDIKIGSGKKEPQSPA